jgi:1-aminocyclopropane-1-carboxylate deaminase
MVGCQEILKEIDQEIDHIFVAQGTTTTSCGLLFGTQDHQQLHVVPVLKGFDSVAEMNELFWKTGIDQETIAELMERVVVYPDAHVGGYAKWNPELIAFIREFYAEHGVQLDPVYTGKAMFQLMRSLESSEFNDTNVLFIHTGGLQGISGIEEQLGEKLFA